MNTRGHDSSNNFFNSYYTNRASGVYIFIYLFMCTINYKMDVRIPLKIGRYDI